MGAAGTPVSRVVEPSGQCRVTVPVVVGSGCSLKPAIRILVVVVVVVVLGCVAVKLM